MTLETLDKYVQGNFKLDLPFVTNFHWVKSFEVRKGIINRFLKHINIGRNIQVKR